jgi:hypothetical protein
VTLITLNVTPQGDRTQVSVEYDRTSLVPEADSHVQEMAKKDRSSGPEWQAQINHYLQARPNAH